MDKQKKSAVVEELSKSIIGSTGVILTEYQGLSVAEISELRAKLRKQNCQYKVIKNTLAKIAFKGTELESFASNFSGPTAVVVQKGDPSISAKTVINFAKDHAKLKLMLGFLSGKVLTPSEVKNLASLPSKEVLIGKLLGSMKSPLYGLVSVMSGTTRKFVYVLESIRKQKATQA